MTVVFDTNTVVRAIFWPRSTDRCAFVGLARRQFIAAVSSIVFDEYERIAMVTSGQFLRCLEPIH